MPEPDVITSLQNSQVKQLVRLRSRREREAEGVILVEGARELSRALTAGFLPLAIYTCDALYSPEAVEVERVLPDPRVRLSREAFEKVSGRENPDGLLATLPAPSPACRCLKRTPSSSCCTVWKNPATSARSCERPTRRGPLESSSSDVGPTRTAPT